MRLISALFAFVFAATMFAQTSIPRPEHPRPQFVRDNWVNLNGTWTYVFDFGESGLTRGLQRSKGFENNINVPFCPESKLSGVQDTDFINNIWYQRTITMPKEWEGRNVKLNFGAVYYNSEVYIDGRLVGRHFGGSTSFAYDVTKFIVVSQNIRDDFAKSIRI